MDLDIVILAAGQGKRMHSSLPKVLHPVGGVAMLERVVTTAQTLSPREIFVVYGNGGSVVREHMSHLNVTWVEQKERKGTGHALQLALPELKENNRVLILYGDVPLISSKTLQQLLNDAPESGIGLLVTELEHPKGFGRVVRNKNDNVAAIVEHKDATEEQRAIKEINSGILTAPVSQLAKWLPKLNNDNAQQEYYLTDIIALSVADKKPVLTVKAEPEEVQGVNDRIELAKVERGLQQRLARHFLKQGVTLLDPARFDCRGELTVEKDVTFDINVIVEGKVTIGSGSRIGANSILKNVTIGDNVVIEANSVLEDATVENDAVIGPFARIRPGSVLKAKSKVGNFVEVKNSELGANTKANHLSYIGDATIGDNVNMGAGTITVNYDGAFKHRTVIESGAFIGCDTQLIAPVNVGMNAFIAAGSTITQDAPPNELTIARSVQKTVKGWQRPKKD